MTMKIIEILERIDLLNHCSQRESNNGNGWISDTTETSAQRELKAIAEELQTLYLKLKELRGTDKERTEEFRALSEGTQNKVDFIVRYKCK